MSPGTVSTARLSRCVSCASHRVTEIAMTLTDGSPVAFLSCHACEHRTWRQNGTELAFAAVLSKAQKHK